VERDMAYFFRYERYLEKGRYKLQLRKGDLVLEGDFRVLGR